MIHQISDLLDALVDQIRTEHPNIDEWPRRQRAVAIARYLRAYNYTGIPTELHYRDLQNNYIGIALQDPDHPSSPSISVAIYCCVARRLGLYAYSCGFPNHPHAVVKLDPGGVPDGTHGDEGPGEVPLLYLDPYRTDAEIPIEHLRSQLAAWGVNPVQFQRFLGESSTRNIVLRTSRNILATVHEFRGLGGGAQNTGHPTIRLYGNPFADLDDAFYSALWANFMLCSPPAQPDPTEQAQFLPMILERFERLYPMDANLIERYVYPAFRSAAPPDQFGLPETLRVVRTTDSMPKQVRSRGPPGSLGDVKYFVGQVFQHKRYGYTAVIIGWDVECSMNPQWMARNQIDRLSQGRNQSFYHAL
jgi:F-box protein 21